MPFDPQAYGSDVARLLNLVDDGQRLIPLVSSGGREEQALKALKSGPDLFREVAHPRGAHAGLLAYFSCFDEAHEIAQEDHSAEGSFWHAILHRQEPDAGNSRYWFGRVGRHALYPAIAEVARDITGRNSGCGFRVGTSWEPGAFVDFCDEAREKPGSTAEQAALEIQRAEWQILFDHCARGRQAA